jgi:hypothetical protein
MDTVSDKTKAAAQQVLDYINEHPEHHNQKYWISTADYEDGADLEGTDTIVDFNACGTTMCIAGTATWIARGRPLRLNLNDVNSSAEGQEFLGVDDDVASKLFWTTSSDKKAVAMLEALAEGDAPKFNRVYKSWDYDDDRLEEV